MLFRSGTDLEDFETHVLTTQFSRTVRPTYDFDITGRVARFRNLDDRSETDDVSITLGVSHDFSETTRGSIEVGYRETEETTDTERGEDTGYVFLARLTDRSELARFDGFLRHDLSPSGLGQPVQTTQFRMRWRKAIYRKLSFLLRTNIFRNEALGGGSSSADRRYADIESGLSWRWRPQWFLTGRYRYRYSKFDEDPESTRSNAVFLDITYAFYGSPASY